jgi:hypothetical protein
MFGSRRVCGPIQFAKRYLMNKLDRYKVEVQVYGVGIRENSLQVCLGHDLHLTVFISVYTYITPRIARESCPRSLR